MASCASGANHLKSRHEKLGYSDSLKRFLKDYTSEQHCEVQRKWIEQHGAETKNGSFIVEHEMDLRG